MLQACGWNLTVSAIGYSRPSSVGEGRAHRSARLDVPAFAVTAGYSGEPPLDSRYVMPLSFNFGFFLH
jgi:hypothetical protein